MSTDTPVRPGEKLARYDTLLWDAIFHDVVVPQVGIGLSSSIDMSAVGRLVELRMDEAAAALSPRLFVAGERAVGCKTEECKGRCVLCREHFVALLRGEEE